MNRERLMRILVSPHVSEKVRGLQILLINLFFGFYQMPVRRKLSRPLN